MAVVHSLFLFAAFFRWLFPRDDNLPGLLLFFELKVALELALQLRAAEWLESIGDTRRATRHLLAAQQVDRALALLHDHVASDFLHDPAPPAALDLSLINPALLVSAPDRLLGLAAHLLLWGDVVQGGQYLDQLERAQPAPASDSRLAARVEAMQSLRHALAGDVRAALRHALAARSIEERALPGDEWNAVVPLVLLRAYTWLEDVESVDLTGPGAEVTIPGLPEATSVRVEGSLKDFYLRLVGAGKPKQVALIAVARKLLLALNEMVRSNQPWRAANNPILA